MKPITITLQDEETVRAIMDSLVINLIDTNAMACKYEQACDRLMTEILNSPPQTPLDEKRIIESVSTLRALNDELRKSEQEKKEKIKTLREHMIRALPHITDVATRQGFRVLLDRQAPWEVDPLSSCKAT